MAHDDKSPKPKPFRAPARSGRTPLQSGIFVGDKYSDTGTRELLEVLHEVSTREVVQEFLRERGVTPFSAGTWAQTEERVLNAVLTKQISNIDLTQLVRDSEECGGQHVFLYHEPTHGFLATKSRESLAALKLDGLDNVLADLALHPTAPTVAEVRWDDDREPSLIIKIVEVRESRDLADQYYDEDGEHFYKQYNVEHERVVHVLRVNASGLIELRIASHSSQKYEEEIARLWQFFGRVIPRRGLTEVDLGRVKEKLFADRASFKGLIQFKAMSLKNNRGTEMTTSCGRGNGDLMDDPDADETMAAFDAGAADSWCDRTNVYFLPQAGHAPAKKIHVITSGLHHEFCIAQKCSKDDYEHVLRQILLYNT